MSNEAKTKLAAPMCEPQGFFELLVNLAQTEHISPKGITGEAMSAVRHALAAHPPAQEQPAPADERDRLRSAQAEAVMPLIGPLLDAWECCAQACREELPELDKQLRRINRAMEDAAPTHPTPAERAEQPHADDAAVDVFAAAMKAKLAAARDEGRSGWQTCSPEVLSEMLRDHVEKGDPRDVANFCMFLWSLGSGITAPLPGSEAFDRWVSGGMGVKAERAEQPPTLTPAQRSRLVSGGPNAGRVRREQPKRSAAEMAELCALEDAAGGVFAAGALAEQPPRDAVQQGLKWSPADRGELAGDGKPCPNKHDPDCRWPSCLCRQREATLKGQP